MVHGNLSGLGNVEVSVTERSHQPQQARMKCADGILCHREYFDKQNYRISHPERNLRFRGMDKKSHHISKYGLGGPLDGNVCQRLPPYVLNLCLWLSNLSKDLLLRAQFEYPLMSQNAFKLLPTSACMTPDIVWWHDRLSLSRMIRQIIFLDSNDSWTLTVETAEISILWVNLSLKKHIAETSLRKKGESSYLYRWWLRSPGVVWVGIHLRSELCDGFGALRDSVLGELSRQDKPDCCLDLPGCDCGLLGVASQRGCLIGDLLKDVIDEGVQNWHCFGADSSVRVDLQYRKNLRKKTESDNVCTASSIILHATMTVPLD